MKRRFFRGVSLAFVPLALAGSTLSYYSKEIRLQLFGTKQERAIAEIEGRAGTYKRDETLPGKPIVRVDLSFAEIDEHCLKVVGSLPHLQYLNLLETAVTDEDIAKLGALKELRTLNLMSTPIRGAGLLQLKSLDQLQKLNLECTQLGDDSLACIACLSSLRDLDLGFTGITDRALAGFKAADSRTTMQGRTDSWNSRS